MGSSHAHFSTKSTKFAGLAAIALATFHVSSPEQVALPSRRSLVDSHQGYGLQAEIWELASRCDHPPAPRRSFLLASGLGVPLRSHRPLGEHLGKLEGVAQRWPQQARDCCFLRRITRGRSSRPPDILSTSRPWVGASRETSCQVRIFDGFRQTSNAVATCAGQGAPLSIRTFPTQCLKFLLTTRLSVLRPLKNPNQFKKPVVSSWSGTKFQPAATSQQQTRDLAEFGHVFWATGHQQSMSCTP